MEIVAPTPPSRPVLSVVAFLAIGVLINLILSFAYERIVEAKTTDARQIAYYEAFDEPIRVLVVGASHSRGGFDVRLTEEAFTYAFPSEGFPMIYYRMKRVLDEHPEVEHVIAPIGPYYFSDRGDAYPEQWIGFQEAFAFGAAGGDTWGYLKDAFRRHVFPYAGQSQKTFDFARGGRGGEETERNDILRGYQPSYNHLGPRRMQESAEKVVATHYTGGIDPIHANYLERIAALCAERGIKLTLVDWPVTERYARLAEGRYDLAVMEEALARARTHLPITLVELREAFLDREYLFGNSDHLNAAGSFLATRMIVEQAGLPLNTAITEPLPPPPTMRRMWERVLSEADSAAFATGAVVDSLATAAPWTPGGAPAAPSPAQ